MNKTARRLFAFLIAMSALPAHAHPLHGAASDIAAGFAHPFLGLDHVLAAIAVGFWAARLGGRALWVVPLSFVCGIAAGGVIGVLADGPIANEPLIAASVLALGVLVAVRMKPPLLLCAAAAAAFAVCHGIAHTAGAASGSWPLLVTGLALGTGACHAAAVGAAIAAPRMARAGGVAIALAGCYLVASFI